MSALRIRVLAAVIFWGSPAELPYCIPPYIMDITTATPTRAARKLMNGLTYWLNMSQLVSDPTQLPLAALSLIMPVPQGGAEPSGQAVVVALGAGLAAAAVAVLVAKTAMYDTARSTVTNRTDSFCITNLVRIFLHYSDIYSGNQGFLYNTTRVAYGQFVVSRTRLNPRPFIALPFN